MYTYCRNVSGANRHIMVPNGSNPPISQYQPNHVGQGQQSVSQKPVVPQSLSELLDQIQCSKWLSKFQAQDVDIGVFYTMTDQDLKEIGIKYVYCGLISDGQRQRKYSQRFNKRNYVIRFNYII